MPCRKLHQASGCDPGPWSNEFPHAKEDGERQREIDGLQRYDEIEVLADGHVAALTGGPDLCHWRDLCRDRDGLADNPVRFFGLVLMRKLKVHQRSATTIGDAEAVTVSARGNLVDLIIHRYLLMPMSDSPAGIVQ